MSKVCLVYQTQTRFARAPGSFMQHDPDGAFYEEEVLLAVVAYKPSKAHREKLAAKYPNSKFRVHEVETV